MSSPINGPGPEGSKRTSTLVAAAIFALVAVSATAIAGYGLLRNDPPPAAVVIPGTAGDDAPSPEPEPVTPEGLTPAQASAIKRLQAEVSELRGLEWKAELPVRIVSKAELGERVKELTAKDRAENADDVADAEAVLKLIGLFPADLDYAGTIDELLSGNILGFYDDETKDLFVGGDPGQPLSLGTQGVVVHELVHALTDQHFDFGTRGRALDDADRTEESFALSALIEGDAEVTSAVWAQRTLSDSQRAQMQQQQQEGSDTETLDDAPPYLLNSLYFPYAQGTEFVTSLVQAGGFAAVDAAYLQPPISTEQILHPETYRPDAGPVAPALPDLANLPGCELRRTGTLGEFDMTELLDLHLASAAARRASGGWNGDTFGLVRCGSALGVVDRWATDTAADVDELVVALSRWAAAWTGGAGPDADGRFSGPGRVGRLARVDGRVELVLAQDQATADRLAAALAQAPPASPANPPT